MKFCLLIFIFCSLLGCVTPRMQLHSARSNYQVQNYNLALRDIMPLAKRGDPVAQYALAYMYFYAEGMSEDKAQAIHWMQLSANQGYVPAQQALTLIQQQEVSSTMHSQIYEHN